MTKVGYPAGLLKLLVLLPKRSIEQSMQAVLPEAAGDSDRAR
jgi:hypothetical protein